MEKKTTKKTTKKTKTRKTLAASKAQKQPKVKWYVLRGYNIDNKDDTGFLSIDKTGKPHQIYKIVESQEDAIKFPSENVYGTKGFGTPKQWFEFFKGEPELEDWKFHLVKVNGPKINKAQEI